MEMIYRGYPQGVPVMQETAAPREPDPWNKRLFRKETEYLKGLYPVSVRRSQVLVDEWFDRYEHPGSPLYDQYPDREWLLSMRDKIWNQAKEQGIEPTPELLYVLLISEVGRRRTEKRL